LHQWPTARPLQQNDRDKRFALELRDRTMPQEGSVRAARAMGQLQAEQRQP